MSKGIAIIDYGIGNIRSLESAFAAVGAKSYLTRDRKKIMESRAVVLPGVGAFKHGIQKLGSYHLDEVLIDFSSTGRPVLGICLGMQMLFDTSEEFGFNKGLGLIPGTVNELLPESGASVKHPHINWNEIRRVNDNDWDKTILEDVASGSEMYFVHGFFVKPHNQKHVLSTTSYAQYSFCSTVKKGNIYGCQFHPEKSGKAGLRILNQFKKISEES